METVSQKIQETLRVNSFKDALVDLANAVENTSKFFGNLDPNDLPNTLRAFKQLHENSTMLDSIKKVVDALYDQYAQDVIPTAFEANGIDSMKLQGRNFILTGRLFCSIPEDKKEEGFKWLSEHGLSALIKPNVNAKQLTSAIAAMLEDEAILPPESAISQHTQKLIVVRKA